MLLVEDGTGLPNADSYISVADATTYLTNFGSGDTWSEIDTDTQEVLLRKSTRDLDALFASSYASDLLSTTQALLWPRNSFTDANGRPVSGLPREVGYAVAELALINSTTDVTGPGDRAGMVKLERTEIVDAIKSWTEYFAPSATNELAIRKLTLLLKPFLSGGSSALSATIKRG
jgi:hypothetical protein